MSPKGKPCCCLEKCERRTTDSVNYNDSNRCLNVLCRGMCAKFQGLFGFQCVCLFWGLQYCYYVYYYHCSRYADVSEICKTNLWGDLVEDLTDNCWMHRRLGSSLVILTTSSYSEGVFPSLHSITALKCFHLALKKKDVTFLRPTDSGGRYFKPSQCPL